MNEIINDYKNTIEKFTNKKFSKLGEYFVLDYYGNREDDDYSFCINNEHLYLSFTNKFTNVFVWLDDIFDLWFDDTTLTIAVKTSANKTATYDIKNIHRG